MKKMNRRVRLAIRGRKNLIKRRIRKFRSAIEEIITKNGYMIQGVNNGEGSFGYTIGRMRSKKPEILLVGLNQSTVRLIEETIEFLKLNVEPMYVPLESQHLLNKHTGKPTRFMIVYANEKDVRNKMLGIHKEIKNLGPVTAHLSPPLKIIVADKYNEFQLGFLPNHGLEENKAAGQRFLFNWPEIVNSIAG